MNLRDLHLPEIGDTCTGINFTEHTERNGMTCVIKKFIEIKEHAKGSCGAIWAPGNYYLCLWADGTEGACVLHNLQVKRKS